MPSRPRFADSRRRLAHLRLASQLLVSVDDRSPAEAVRWMLALQAQDFGGVKWSVALRTGPAAGGATEAGVEAAFDAGEIVRSWPMRGTLHLVAAEDLAWMLALTRDRATASAATRRAALGITEADIERARESAEAALPGRSALSRRALLAAFEAGGVSTVGQRGYHLLWYLAQTGTLVLGPSDGRQQTFARLEAWVPHPRRLDRDEALGELALRYFRSHGPATIEDLVRWSGMTVRDIRRGVAIAAESLTELAVDGRSYLLSAEVAGTASADGSVLLLPGFDEYVLGYRDRSAVLAPEHADAIVPGGNGLFKPTIVVDGEVVGTWRREVSARAVTLEAAPFDGLSPSQVGGLEAAGRRYGRFLDRPVRLGYRGPEV